MAYRGAHIDWISDLPEGIIEKILTLLPIRAAVRTSMLARAWRYKWASMPDLNFYELGFTAVNTVKFINQFLLLHQGPVRKFTVCARTLTVRRKTNQWLLFLSKHDIEELKIHVGGEEYYGFPSCLFDWKKLTCLELCSCKLAVPTTFEGFLNLKILKLLYMMVVSNIERLISKSPLIESLTLYSSSDMITLSAPKIKYLFLQGRFKNICLENSPLLVDMRLGLYADHGDCNLIKVLGGAPNLEKLTMDKSFNEHLNIGFNRGALSTTFNSLKVMSLSRVVLGEREGIPLVLELLISAPNLEKLVIKCLYRSPPTKVDSDFWNKECPNVHGFMKLKVIEMAGISCVASEIELAKFMLCNSPVLEKMEIRSHERRQVIITRIFKKLPKLHRASPRAAVTFHHG